ncbi:uncharacterized protein LOC141595770 [Silene latifolia]|uniref:uncharacterized protein LOC141595770 n=1 Tax=Silene latifolia TaxID=37657 RepID=UPI003D76D7C9
MEDEDDTYYKLPAVTESPWLMCTHENHKSSLEKQTFFTMHNNSYVKKIVDLDGKSILASCHGWLILRERENSTMYSIWNPITQQSILLPELLDSPEEEEPGTCILTSADASCVLLVFFKGLVFWCRPTTARDDCKWVKQSLEDDGQTVVIHHAASVNGDIYAYAYIYYNEQDGGGFRIIFGRIMVGNSDDSSNLVVFEPFSIECPYSSIPTYYPCSTRYLVEVCGDLYVLLVVSRQSYDHMEDYDIFKVFVWRLDLSQLEWIRVDSLGDRAFLLGHNCCTWCWADAVSPLGSPSTLIERNCVYVATFGCQTVHQYRLQDDSYTLIMSHGNFAWSSDGPRWFKPHNPIRPRLSAVQEADKFVSETIKDIQETNPEMNEAMATHCSYPLFMSLKNSKAGVGELRDPCQNISYTVTLPHSPDSTIEFCMDSWLLLRTEKHSLQCLNPFTAESYKYPTDDMIVGLSRFAFSTCPTSSDCLTVGIIELGWAVQISYFQAGNDKWDQFYFGDDLDEDFEVEFHTTYSSNPKYHDEAFYFLDVNGNLGIFKMVEGEWSWKVHKGPILEDVSLNSCYLAELDGQLISTLIENFGNSVKVFKFDNLHKNWVELDDLGDYMLFVSPASSFSVSTKDSSMKNRIYLPKRVDNEMVFYSLDTREYHTSSHDSIKDFYGMSSQSFSCWI